MNSKQAIIEALQTGPLPLGALREKALALHPSDRCTVHRALVDLVHSDRVRVDVETRCYRLVPRPNVKNLISRQTRELLALISVLALIGGICWADYELVMKNGPALYGQEK